MAYYDALIAKWATLSGTTEQKLTQINALTIPGAPVPMIVPTYAVYNLINPAEFSALPTVQQQLVRDILGMGTVDASPGTMIRAQMVARFPNGTQTFAAVAQLAQKYDAPQILWWSAPVSQGGGGLSSPVSAADLAAAGGLS